MNPNSERRTLSFESCRHGICTIFKYSESTFSLDLNPLFPTKPLTKVYSSLGPRKTEQKEDLKPPTKY